MPFCLVELLLCGCQKHGDSRQWQCETIVLLLQQCFVLLKLLVEHEIDLRERQYHHRECHQCADAAAEIAEQHNENGNDGESDELQHVAFRHLPRCLDGLDDASFGVV